MRVWFITGASRGFGALIAEAALAAGDAWSPPPADPKAVIADASAPASRLLATRLDVTSETEAHEAAGQAVRQFGRIDILVNNAGYGLLGAIEEASASETSKLFGTNVFGLLGVTRAVRRTCAGNARATSSTSPRSAATRAFPAGASMARPSSRSKASARRWRVKWRRSGSRSRWSSRLLPHRLPRRDRRWSRTAQHIDDYRDSVGNTRAHAADVNHGQRGDPRKLASAFIALVNAKNPPLRLPLGSDTVERIEAKNAFVAGGTGGMAELATSTDFTEQAA